MLMRTAVRDESLPAATEDLDGRRTPKSVVLVLDEPEPRPMTPPVAEMEPLSMVAAPRADAEIVPAGPPPLPAPTTHGGSLASGETPRDGQPLTDQSVPYPGIAVVGEQKARSGSRRERARSVARGAARGLGRTASAAARITDTITTD